MQGPGQRTLNLMRKRGYTIQVVERYNIFSRKRHDLFGFIDFVAIKPGHLGVVGIQTTSRSNLSSRVHKILNECRENALLWLRTGNVIVVQGWGKKYGKNKKGKRKKTKNWFVTERQITERNFK